MNNILPVAQRNLALTIPEALQSVLYPHLQPFSLYNNRTCDASFSAEFVVHLPPVDDAIPRGELYFSEVSAGQFSLSDHRFVLMVNLDGNEAKLSLTSDTSDAASLIFSAIKWFITFIAIMDGNLPMHSSLITGHSGGVLFCGASGQGKSTISSLVSATLPATVRGSDEINIIALEPDLRVYPTPFISSGGKGTLTDPVELNHVFFLDHAPEHRVESIERPYVFKALLNNVYHMPGNQILTDRMLDTVATVSELNIFRKLFFNNDPSVAYFLTTVTEL